MWGICKAEIRRVRPKTLEVLMEVANNLSASLAETSWRSVRDVRPKAEFCIKMGVGQFESKLKIQERINWGVKIS